MTDILAESMPLCTVYASAMTLMNALQSTYI